MSLPESQSGNSEPRNTVLYWCAGAVALILVVIGLISYTGATEDREADRKAGELITLLQRAGVEPLPSTEQVARVLGTDGGSVCQGPGTALRKATLDSMIYNGAAGPGMRPVITDDRLLAGQLAVISVYCPDEFQKVKQYVDDLKTGDVVRS
jgi:hypothetical protein